MSTQTQGKKNMSKGRSRSINKEIDTKMRRLMIERVELWGSVLAPHSREHFNTFYKTIF
jgi:hypothetical protein